MSELCPCCGRPLPGLAVATVDELRAWCAENGHYVTADGSVYEEAAAAILDRSPGTLRNWRSAGGPVPFTRHGRTGRVRYRLSDLVAALEAARYDE